MKARLIIDVDYELNGEKPETMLGLLGQTAEDAANMGLFSSTTEAEVNEWSYKVETSEASNKPKRWWLVFAYTMPTCNNCHMSGDDEMHCAINEGEYELPSAGTRAWRKTFDSAFKAAQWCALQEVGEAITHSNYEIATVDPEHGNFTVFLETAERIRHGKEPWEHLRSYANRLGEEEA